MKKLKEDQILTYFFEDNGSIPNNPRFPLTIYPDILEDKDDVVAIFASNKWLGAWRDSIFTYHHYHSNSHEVLAVVSGSASVHMGGPQGEIIDINKGDVMVIPAGVGHKRLSSSEDFAVIGAYPNGNDYNLCREGDTDYEARKEEIRQTPLPQTDPLFGEDSFLLQQWRNKTK